MKWAYPPPDSEEMVFEGFYRKHLPYFQVFLAVDREDGVVR